MSRDLEPYRRIWEAQGVVMDAGQMRALREASNRVSRARAGVVAGALLVVLGVPIAVVATPTPSFPAWVQGLWVSFTGGLVVLVMALSGWVWGRVLRGQASIRAMTGVSVVSTIVPFVVMSWLPLVLLQWPWPVGVPAGLVGIAAVVLMFMHRTLGRS